MRKLAFLAITLVGIAQTGCIIVSDDEDTAYFDIGWTLEQGGSTVTCADVGVATVRVQSIAASTNTDYIDLFDCVDGSGLTAPLPLDDYTVSAQVLDAADNNLSEYVPLSASLDVPGEEVMLDYIFAFGPTYGDITFYIDYGDAGGANCDNVVQQEVWLTGVGSLDCVAYPLIIDDDFADPASDTCNAAQNVCMETNVLHTIQGVEAGDYTIMVFGLKGAVSGDPNYCYTYAEDITVTGDLDLGTLGVPWAPLPEDDAACNATKP